MVEKEKVITMMIVGGIVLYGPIEFWIYVSGSAAAFIMLNLVSILHDRDCSLPEWNEGITWLAISTSWISALALVAIATPLACLVIRDSAKRIWKEILG